MFRASKLGGDVQAANSPCVYSHHSSRPSVREEDIRDLIDWTMSEGEKSKGFSLRKNKASRRLGLKTVNEISSPLGAKSPYASEEGYIHGPASTPKALPAERVRATGATSDLIKKRYSVRYTQGPEFSNDTVPPVPDLPSIHKHSAKQSNGEQVALAPSQGVDLRALKDSSLQAEDCENLRNSFTAIYIY